MKFSELKGRAVVDRINAKKIGEVEDLVIEPTTHQILGILLKSGLFSHAQNVPLAEVERIGPDAIMVSENGAKSEAVSSKNITTFSDLLNNKIVTDSGTYVGQVSDVILDPNSLAITAYAFKTEGLFTKPHEFPATPQIHFGEKLVTVPSQLLNQHQPT